MDQKMDYGNISSFDKIQPGVHDYIQFQESLKQRCHKLKDVKEVSKLIRKINAEMKFLVSLQMKDEATQMRHLKSSNLSHFSSLVHAAERLPEVVLVLQPFGMPTRAESLVVDIVAAGGRAWVKVIARKAQALHLVWAGQGQFGERDLVSQAEEYLECAARHPFEFIVPQVHFAFYNQVTQPMADCLRKMGVVVWGEVVPVLEDVQAKLGSLVDDDWESNSDFDESDHEKCDTRHAALADEEGLESSVGISSSAGCSVNSGSETETIRESAHERHSIDGCGDLTGRSSQTKGSVDRSNPHGESVGLGCSDVRFYVLFRHLVASPPEFDQILSVHKQVNDITRVNLDITALVALVSSVTNGNCHFVFRDKILNLQAQEERESPVLPVLETYLKGKEMFTCETAVSSFQSILDTLGGQSEKRRASELFARVQVVKDNPSQRALALSCRGRIKERSKIIFGTGDSLHAVTMTSNMGFVRAAKSQGVVFSVFLHPARALTEDKEAHAAPLSPEHCAASLLKSEAHQ